jgi:hypothetical protein
VITHLFAHEQFDADRFVEILAGIMVETPEVVKVAARHLEAWNDNRCIAEFRDSSVCEEVAEVVLDAAAIFRGETTAEVGDAPPEAGLAIAQHIHEVLRGSRDCFLRAAGGAVSRGAFEAQAAACNRALDYLQRLVGNAPSQNTDKEA